MSRRLKIGTRAVLRGGGALLLLIGVGLAAITEHSLLSLHQAEASHGGDVVEAGANGPQPGLHGSMVLVSGTPQVVEQPHDDDFNLAADTPVLQRRVEMFQWREVNIGGQVHYELDWSDHWQDSARFEQPKGHVNPPRLPLQSRQFVAELVRVGGFTLGPKLIQALPGSVSISPEAAHLPANLAASFSRDHDYLTTSADPADPHIGDVRVSWQAVPLQPVTVFARLDGNRLVAGPSNGDGHGYQVQVGTRSLGDVLPDLPEPPPLVTLRRIGAMLLAAGGTFLLLLDRRRRGSDLLLALAVGVSAIGAVSCACWLGGDGSMVLRWLALTVAGALVVVLLQRPLRRS